MNAAEEHSKSLWSDADLPKAPRLACDIDADVAIIGAGISGLSAAYEMIALGKTVAVLDAGSPGGGMTARTSGHLSFEFDDYYKELDRLHGKDASKAYFRSQKEAVARIEHIATAEGIECDFKRVDGFLFAADEKSEKEIDEEYEAAREAGFSNAALLATVPGLWTRKAIRFPDQARFHPLKYLAGLVEVLHKKSVRIFGDTRVLSVDDKGDHVLVKVEGDLYVKARHAIVATNSPINDLVAMHTKQAPYRTYVVAAPVPKGSVPDALMWDTEDPYHYARIEPREKDDLLIVGGEDHKSGTKNDASLRFERLQNWADKYFGESGKPEFQWSGQVYAPVDHVNFAGLNPGDRNVYIITGDSGEGLTSGVAGAMLIASLIKGTADKEVAALYDLRASRFSRHRPLPGRTQMCPPTSLSILPAAMFRGSRASRPGRAGSCGRALRRSRPFATRKAAFISSPRPARISDASCISTIWRNAGTVPVTVRNSRSTARCSQDRRGHR
jgi:hypothetical protein